MTVRPPNECSLFVDEHAKHVSASQAVPQRRVPARPQSSVALGPTSANCFHATSVLTHLSHHLKTRNPSLLLFTHKMNNKTAAATLAHLPVAFHMSDALSHWNVFLCWCLCLCVCVCENNKRPRHNHAQSTTYHAGYGSWQLNNKK